MLYYSIDHPDPDNNFTVTVAPINVVGPGEDVTTFFFFGDHILCILVHNKISYMHYYSDYCVLYNACNTCAYFCCKCRHF